ncbi:MAG: hypothetical protein PHY93_06045 [Bacteriovorax sp.]|nr:hypothetical protein [Bacteriovorax sp.]
MSNNEDGVKDSKKSTEETIETRDHKKNNVSFGSLTPLTTAQIITLLVGTTGSNSSYGGY